MLTRQQILADLQEYTHIEDVAYALDYIAKKENLGPQALNNIYKGCLMDIASWYQMETANLTKAIKLNKDKITLYKSYLKS